MTGSIPPVTPLAYEGSVAVPYYVKNKAPLDPTTSNNQFPVPTIWIDPVTPKAYILVQKPLGIADWLLFAGGSGTLIEIDTPSGGPVLPVAGVVNFANGTGMNIVGSGNTVTFNLSGSVADLFTADDATTATPSSGDLIISGGSTGLTTTASGHTMSLTGTLAINHGGTDATSFSTNNGTVKYDGTRLVTSTTALIDSLNRTTNTSQPCFLVYLTTNVSNVTGDGTPYNLLFDTPLFDQNSNITLNSSGKTIFTAPVTGNYLFNVVTNFTISVSTVIPYMSTMITLSSGAVYRFTESWYPTGSTLAGQTGSIIIPMTAAQTAYLTVVVSGQSMTSLTSTFRGVSAGITINYWSGQLLC